MSRKRKPRFRLSRAGKSYLNDAIRMVTIGIVTLVVVGGSVFLAMKIGSW